MHTDELTKEEADIMEGLKTNMYIPNIIHIQGLITLLSTNGFSNINPRNITENVVAPIDYYSTDEQKLNNEGIPLNDMETLIAGLQKLLRNGKAGYYILTAQKKRLSSGKKAGKNQPVATTASLKPQGHSGDGGSRSIGRFSDSGVRVALVENVNVFGHLIKSII